MGKFFSSVNSFKKWVVLAMILAAVSKFSFEAMPTATTYSEWWAFVAMWFASAAVWFYWSYLYTLHLKREAYHLGYGVMWFLIVVAAVRVAIAISAIFEAIGMIYG